MKIERFEVQFRAGMPFKERIASSGFAFASENATPKNFPSPAGPQPLTKSVVEMFSCSFGREVYSEEVCSIFDEQRFIPAYLLMLCDFSAICRKPLNIAALGSKWYSHQDMVQVPYFYEHGGERTLDICPYHSATKWPDDQCFLAFRKDK